MDMNFHEIYRTEAYNMGHKGNYLSNNLLAWIKLETQMKLCSLDNTLLMPYICNDWVVKLSVTDNIV